MNVEPEITADVDLATPEGRLNPDAVGWSRRPRHRCRVPKRPETWSRGKRWVFWGLTTSECQFQVTYADVDYVGLVESSLLDFESGRRTGKAVILPLAPGVRVPERCDVGGCGFGGLGLRVRIDEEPGGTRLRAAFRDRSVDVDADAYVERPAGHETLNVVIPWNERRYHFTSKQNTRPALGSVRVGGRSYELGPETAAYGTLDYGAGVWERDTKWNWGAASGETGGRVVGVNLGGRWTDGTGMTENGICVDGRLSKIGEDLLWEYDRAAPLRPWRIRASESGRVDLEFSPRLDRGRRVNLGLVHTDLVWAFGTYAGTVVTDGGERIEVAGLPGWAEDHEARW